MISPTEDLIATYNSPDYNSRAEIVLRLDGIFVKKYVCKEMLSLEGPFKNMAIAKQIAEDFTSCSY